MKQDVFGFYHIGTIGRWKDILNDQLSVLQNTDLLSKTKKIFVGISGTEELPILDDKFEIIVRDPILGNGEVETLKCLHKFCQTIQPSKIWYIHTKGASNVPGTRSEHHGENTPQVIVNVDSWRKYMEYFIIEKHENCIAALDEYDVCGVEYRLYRKPHFVGNFWWANSEYIKKLENIMTSIEPGYSGRYAAETGFIGIGNPKVKCFFKVNRDMYFNMIKPLEYRFKIY